MKHFVLIIILAVGCYVLWQAANGEQRHKARKFIKRHGPRIGIILVAALLLLSAAYYLPSTTIL